jgi:hypothetical protein
MNWFAFGFESFGRLVLEVLNVCSSLSFLASAQIVAHRQAPEAAATRKQVRWDLNDVIFGRSAAWRVEVLNRTFPPRGTILNEISHVPSHIV